MTFDDVRREALRLGLTQRAELARSLLASLDDRTEDEVEQLWLREAARRLFAINAGEVETIPARLLRRSGDQPRSSLRSLGPPTA